jgi:glycosyltransferase involved in cell wall biosynthesis
MNIQNRYSAILTTYNCETTVEASIMSILNQKIPPFELLITDDASTDKTMQILDGITTTYGNVKLLRNSENMGQSLGRNRCAAAAQSEYLIFFDDDDISISCRAELHLKMFENGSDLNFVSSEKKYGKEYSTSAINDEVGPIVFAPNDMATSLLLGRKAIALNFYVPSCTLAVNKSAFLELQGFDQHLRRLEDIDLALRASRKSMKFAFSSQVGVSRKYTLGTDKGGGIDAHYESVLLEKHREYITYWDFKNAKSWQHIRRFYFERNWKTLFFYSLSNPLVWLQLVLRIRSVTSRVKHDRIK